MENNECKFFDKDLGKNGRCLKTGEDINSNKNCSSCEEEIMFKKSSIGVVTHKTWVSERIKYLSKVISDYSDAKIPINEEWHKELIWLTEGGCDYNK